MTPTVLPPDLKMNSSLSQIMEAIMSNMDSNMTAELMSFSPEERTRFLEETMKQFEDIQNGVDSEQIKMQFIEYRIHRALSIYLPPLFLIMGTFGNIFSFLILRNKTMTRQSTNLFLAALAVADSIVLFVGLLRRWVGDIGGIDVQSESDWLCKTVSVLGYSSSQFSVWLIIAVTVERYIVVSHPLHASGVCNVTRAKRVIAFLAFVFISINLHLLWTVTLEENVSYGHLQARCKPKTEFVFLVSVVWQWIDATLYALAPFLLIVVFNLLIIIQTIKATTWRGAAQNGPLIKMEKRKLSNDNNVKITVMLLSVSFTFLLTTFPMAIVMVCHRQWNEENQNSTLKVVVQRQLLRTVAEMLMYLNHSINFYLYCALGQKFRNQVIRTLCGRTVSNTSNMSDHSQHLYCSRGCKINGYHLHKSTDETAL